MLSHSSHKDHPTFPRPFVARTEPPLPAHYFSVHHKRRMAIIRGNTSRPRPTDQRRQEAQYDSHAIVTRKVCPLVSLWGPLRVLGRDLYALLMLPSFQCILRPYVTSIRTTGQIRRREANPFKATEATLWTLGWLQMSMLK